MSYLGDFKHWEERSAEARAAQATLPTKGPANYFEATERLEQVERERNALQTQLMAQIRENQQLQSQLLRARVSYDQARRSREASLPH